MKRLKKPLKILLIVVIILGIIAAAGALAWHFLASPETGTVTKSSANSQPPPPPTPLLLQAKHFVVNYTSDFNSVSDISSQDATAVEQYRLSTKNGGVTGVNISLHTLPTGGVKEDSGYQFRKTRPTLYSESTKHYSGGDAIVMFKNDESEATAFMAHATYIGTISVTSNNPNRPALDTLSKFLDSYKWIDK